MQPLTSDQIRGNWATLLLAWNNDDSLDAGRVADEIDVLLAIGVDGIYCNGTAGEFHALTEHEFDRLADLLASKCERSRMPFQIGASHMSAQLSLERLRRAVSLKPSAVQVILPDWFPLSDQEAENFLQRMAEAAQGVGLVLYNPPHAKRVLAPAEIGRLAQQVPALVGVKVADGDEAWYAAMQQHAGRLSIFVPGHHLATGISRGAHGAYSNVACLHPKAAQRWCDQIKSDLPGALELEGRLRQFMDRHIAPFIRQQRYCPAACDRLLALIGGWADAGSRMRWPYRSIPVSEADRLRPIARTLLPEFFEEEKPRPAAPERSGREAEQKITYLLEMSSRDDLRPPRQPAVPFQVNRVEIPCPELNWFLHQAVGAEFRWGGRENWGRQEWSQYVDRSELETWVACVAGTPAGYYELERQADASLRIVCFGLLRQFFGKRLGGALLASAVQRCWELGATRVWLRTSSHDHPHALQNYLARGFTLVSQTSSAANPPCESALFGLRAME